MHGWSNSSDGVDGIVIAPFVYFVQAGSKRKDLLVLIDSLRFTSPERGFMVIEINHMESCVCALEMGGSENEGARRDVTEKYERSGQKESHRLHDPGHPEHSL